MCFFCQDLYIRWEKEEAANYAYGMVKALITHDPVGRLDQYSQLLYVDCSRYDGAGVYLFYRDGTLVPLRAQKIGDTLVDESGAVICGELVGKAVAGVCFYPPPCLVS